MLFPLTVWVSYMWLKTAGYSNSVVGMCSLLVIPSLFKLPALPYLLRVQWGQWAGGSNKARLLSVSALLFCGATLGAAFVTPYQLIPFFGLMIISAMAASVVETMLEMLRLDSQYFDAPPLSQDSIVTYLGLGDRLGSIISKPVFLFFVAMFSWPVALVGAVVVFLIFMHAAHPLDKAWASVEKKAHPETELKASIVALRERWGWVVFVFPMLLLFNESFVRPMIGVMLVDAHFAITDISVGYAAMYAGGIVGTAALIHFLPQRNDVQRLWWAGALNAAVNALFSFLWIYPSWTSMMVLMFLSGASQNVFLQLFRIILGQLCTPNAQFLQMSFLLSLWALMAPIAALSGVFADIVRWNYYFVILGLLYIPGGLMVLRILRTRQ